MRATKESDPEIIEADNCDVPSNNMTPAKDELGVIDAVTDMVRVSLLV